MTTSSRFRRGNGSSLPLYSRERASFPVGLPAFRSKMVVLSQLGTSILPGTITLVTV